MAGAVPRPGSGRKSSPALARVLRGLAAAALLAAGLVAAPQQAQAQTAYVSNSDVLSTSAYGVTSNAWFGMEFTTGSQSGGYALGSIGLVFADTRSSTTNLVVRLYTESGGLPDTLVDTLENPGSLTALEEALFTPSTSVTLAADTSYIVTVEATGGQTWHWRSATSGAEDSGASAGWSIGTRLFRGGESDDWATRTNWMSLAVYAPDTVTTPTPTETKLVGNLDETPNSTHAQAGTSSSLILAQLFDTGSADGGYTLTSVQLYVHSWGASDEEDHVEITIREEGSDNRPDSTVYTLSNPTSITNNALNTFTAGAGATLEADTGYFVVVAPTSTAANFQIGGTGANGEDSNSATGWSIGNRRFDQVNNDGTWRPNNSSLRVAINGYSNTTNTLPTAANNTVTTDEDTNHVFTAADFNFSDDDAGDALASVKITTLEAAGRLMLGTDDVALNAVVTKTQIDEGKLKFVPDADANGAAYATFQFKVSDGTDESASAYTMTIDVTAVNDPPTAEDNTVTTDQDTAYTFTATDFGFMDVDGDTLTSVRIESLPANGVLALDGTAVEEDDLITKTDIDGAKLVFTPTSGESGSPYTTFQFKVNDGTTLSDLAYTMTINVTAALPAASVLIGNLGETNTGHLRLTDDLALGQGFSTGRDFAVLESVDVRFQTIDAEAEDWNHLTAAVWRASDDDDSVPGTLVATLEHPTDQSKSSVDTTRRFTAPANTVLKPATTYFLVFTDTDAITFNFSVRSTGTADDADGAEGWEMFDQIVRRPSGGDWSAVIDSALKIRVNGTVQMQRMCDAGALWCETLIVGGSGGTGAKGYCKDVVYPCNGGSENYGRITGDGFDLDGTDYTVESVRWAGVSGGVDGDDIPKLHLTLDQDLPASDLATLTLKVGTHEFALADASRGRRGGGLANNYRWENRPTALENAGAESTWTVQLVRTEPAANATGKPSISGPPQVGKALTAGIGDIADEDDLPSTTFPAGYTFQWIEVDGGTETDISGATSQTYTPGTGNVTKAIKVRVSFTDGGGNAESLTSDETWAVMPAASSNCTGNGTVWCGTLTVGQPAGDETRAGFDGLAGSDFGSVDPATFTLFGGNYSFDKLSVGGGHSLLLSTTPDLPSHGAGLSLHVQTISGEVDSPLAGYRTPGVATDWQFDAALYNDDTTAPSDFPLLRVHSSLSLFSGTTPIGTEVAVRLSYDAARDPTLSDLEVENAADGTDIALTPSTFDSATTTYTASVANGVSQVTIIPTANGSGATFEYLDHTGTEIDDDDGAKDDWQVPLAVGTNRIRVKVTAETGGATETYMLVLTRAAPNATTSLVSNTGQTADSSPINIGNRDRTHTQQFTTGSNTNGYDLTSVGVYVDDDNFSGSEALTVHIYTADASGADDTLVYTLTSPMSYTEGEVNLFTAPANATLAKDTNYLVVFVATGNSQFDFKVGLTASDAEDAGSLSGWSIEDARRFNDSLSGSSSIMISVNGTARTTPIDTTNTAPTASDNTVTTAEDTEYTFEADDFGFEDDDAGDTLASVKITVLATDGELRLDGTAVQANDVISKSDIDGGKLTFVPDVNENGASYATFKFRVNDGTVDSAAEYTMTVDVTAVDDAPADALVSNLDQADDTEVSLGGAIDVAQQFTTGPNAGGYTLTGVDVRVEGDHSARTFSVSVCTVDASGYPTSSCTALTAPGDFTVRDLSFTAPANTVLPADTMYAVFLDLGNSGALLDATTSDGEDAGSAAGWSLADAYFWNNAGTWTTFAGGKELRIAVRGAAKSGTDTDASGAPAITGTPQAGQALTAAIGTIADVDGLPTTFPDDYTFQWVRVDGGTGTDISGATSGTYTLTDEDVGKTIRVEVSFTDDGGNSEGPLASAETAAVVAAAEDCTTDRAGADWCTTLTVETLNQSHIVIYGFDAVFSTPYGAVEDDTIEYGGTDFTVQQIRLDVNSVFPSNSAVQVKLDAFLPRDTVFDLGGHEFTADADAEHAINEGTYDWDLPTGLSWIEGQKVTVSATLGNFPPTASDNTVTTAEDTEYTFTVADFGFEDLDGDDLASVQITGLEDKGDLEFDDADVTEDQVITKSDIEAGKLTFTPASGENGDDYTTFAFTVNDGTDDSASSYIMTIDVTAADANATGAPAVTGVPQAGMTLTAGIGTITDPDGLTSRTFPGDYTFQWVRTAAGTESDISGATSGTYTLTAADVGATIKVEVSFDDDDDNAEGPLASADTAAVLAAADDCATDRAGADWCTTLTVGVGDFGSVVQYGFDGVAATPYGTLEDDTIDNGGTDFTVEWILLHVDSTDPASSYVQVDLDDFLQRRTVFDLGGPATFTTDFASETSNLGRYEWTLPAGMSWIEGQEVTVSAVLGDNFAPTAADGTITTMTDTPFELAVSDFGFEDADDGDALSSVRITDLATDGELTLDGTGVFRKRRGPLRDVRRQTRCCDDDIVDIFVKPSG